jgi:hypothetical protein
VQVQINTPAGKESSGGAPSRGRKPRKGEASGTREEEQEQEALADLVLSDEPADSRINVDIPMELKCVLCCDMDMVVHQKRLFTIPAKVS